MNTTSLDPSLLHDLAMVGLQLDTPIPETPGSFSGDTKERPRKRTLIACDLCKVRHIKCDGSGKNPCTSCTNLKAECKYTTPTTKRGPKRTQKRPMETPSSTELLLTPIDAPVITPKIDWATYLDMFNSHIKPLYGSIFHSTSFPLELNDVEKALSSGFSAKQIQKKFLSLCVLANGAMLAKNIPLAEQLASEANFMIGGIIGSPSFETATALLLLGSFYCVGVGDFVRGASVNALAYQMTEILDVSKAIQSVNGGYMFNKDQITAPNSTAPATISKSPSEEALASLKARILSKLIMNTPDPDDREYLLTKAMKLPSNRMEIFFVLHSYIVSKARDPLPADQTQATNNIFKLFTWVEKADGIVRDVENSPDSPVWVGAMMRTMLDSCKVCLLHKMGLRDEAITLAEKTRLMIEKEMTAKHYGIGYQCATVAISKVYEQLRNPELLANFLHTMEYVADVFVSMKLKVGETKDILHQEILHQSPTSAPSSVVELPSSSTSSPQSGEVPANLATSSSNFNVNDILSASPGLDGGFFAFANNEDPNLLYSVAAQNVDFSQGQPQNPDIQLPNLEYLATTTAPSTSDVSMFDLNLSGQF